MEKIKKFLRGMCVFMHSRYVVHETAYLTKGVPRCDTACIAYLTKQMQVCIISSPATCMSEVQSKTVHDCRDSRCYCDGMT